MVNMGRLDLYYEGNSIRLCTFFKSSFIYLHIYLKSYTDQSAGAVEYIDYVSAEE